MELNSVGINLRDITTFGLPANVRLFEIHKNDDILNYFSNHKDEPYFVLGAGSNIIYSESIENKNILQIKIKGIQILEKINNEVLVQIGAGEIWDDVVSWAVENNLSGIEALSAIPGTAGATPVQNVGAYGKEIKDVFVSLEAYDTEQNKFVEITKNQCMFSYRQSIFKTTHKNRYIITSIKIKLFTDQPGIPDYPGIVSYFKEKNIDNPSVLDIRNAIIEIRWSKLPHPEELGNCGSFFENPIIDINLANEIKMEYSDLPIYKLNENLVKIPAGYLIEKSGLKGLSFGNVGTYENNALVLVNLGNARYEDVLNAKNMIINTVKDKFSITLESEPEFVQ